MITSLGPRDWRKAVAFAAECAGSLAAVVAVVGFVGWCSGLASLEHIPSLLAGVFIGSFVAALFGYKPEARRSRQ